MSTTFNFGLRLCVCLWRPAGRKEKPQKTHGVSQNKAWLSVTDRWRGEGGGHVYTAVYDKQPYTCVYYMRRI